MDVGPWRVALSVQTSLVQASWTAVRLMIGYRALAMGADPFFLGVLATSFALPALPAALPAGRVADRVGGPLVALVGMVIAAVGTIGAFALPGLWLLLVSSGAIGLGQIIIMIGQQTFVANVSTDGSSDAAFGTLTAAASVGQVIGPPLVTMTASLAAVDGHTQPNTTVGLATCLVMVVLGAPAYLLLRRTGHSRPTPRPGDAPSTARELVRIPQMWRSLTVSGAVLVSLDLMYAFVPLWADDRGIGATTVGWLLALRAAVTVLSRVGLTRLVQRFGRKLLITVSIAAAVAGLVALPFVGAAGAVVVMIALGVGLGIPQPLTMSWVTSLTPDSAHGAALGLRLTSNRLAQITVPLALGALAGPFGLAGIFWANAVMLLGAMGVMARANSGEAT